MSDHDDRVENARRIHQDKCHDCESYGRQSCVLADLLDAYDALKADHEALQERLEEVGAELIRERRKTEQIARARWYQGDRLDSASRHAKEMGEDR